MINYNFPPMAETGNREIVEKFFQALNAHDWDGWKPGSMPNTFGKCRSRANASAEYKTTGR